MSDPATEQALAALLSEVRYLCTRFDKLEMKVVRVEERQNSHGELGSTVDEQGSKLEDHERRLSSLERNVGNIRQNAQAMVDNIERVSDALTVATGGLKRLEDLLLSDRTVQQRRDVQILRALERVLETHQPKVEL